MIEYRQLTHEDYEDIVDISKDIWDGEDYLPLVFHKWVDSEGYFLGAVDSEKKKVVGVGKLSFLHDNSGWLEGLRVHKDYRGQKIARKISERLLDMAKNYLKEGKIKRIAFSTHVTNKESSTLMKKLNFKVEAEFLIVSKGFEKLDKDLCIEDFKQEVWNPTLEEFMKLSFFKRRNNILPLCFYFQEPTEKLYEEFKEKGGFVSINGHKGIYMFKEGPNFACMDETYDAIDTYMNYYLLKYNGQSIPSPVTSIMPEDTKLAERFKNEGYEAWADWQPDYLYFIYME